MQQTSAKVTSNSKVNKQSFPELFHYFCKKLNQTNNIQIIPSRSQHEFLSKFFLK